MGSAAEDVQLKDFGSIFRLDGKVAVVTGGSRGLGLHAASGLLQAGCSKVFITSRKAKACEEAVDALNALGTSGRAIAVPADVAKQGEVERLVKEVEKHTEHVDILLANAGASWASSFEDHSEDAFQKVMDLNVKSVFLCIQKFAPLLEKRGTVADPSRVVCTASSAGIGLGTLGASFTPAYAASKAAVLHLARNLAVELGPRHILVNSIAPGFIPSKMATPLIGKIGGTLALGAESPNGRLGSAEDIAGTIVWLCSRAASHVNGEAVRLDGGTVLAKGRL